MGSFFSFLTALHKPQLVQDGKIIMLAPAVTFGLFTPGWTYRAIVSLTLQSERFFRHFYNYHSAEPNFTLESVYPPNLVELILASNELGATIAGAWPVSFSDDQLGAVCADKNKCLLGIGDQEVVIDAQKAVQRANGAGIAVQLYPGTGHLMYYQQPFRNKIAQDVIHFFTTGSVVDSQ